MNLPLALVLATTMVCGALLTLTDARSQPSGGSYQGVSTADPGVLHLVDTVAGRVARCAVTGAAFRCTEWSEPPR